MSLFTVSFRIIASERLFIQAVVFTPCLSQLQEGLAVIIAKVTECLFCYQLNELSFRQGLRVACN